MPAFIADITVGQVALWVGLIGSLTLAVKKVWPWLSRFKDFIDDLMGEPARPGVKARPGVMLRLAAHEVEMQQIRALATSAEYHSKPNGGGSAYDQLLTEVKAIGGRLDDHVIQANDIHDEQAAAIAHLAEALPIVARSTPHPDDATDDVA